ncbi:hypothetical protein EPUS_04427 [Endocarpon pusillum Z07020]|uniref:Lincomycin-condensing protein lmbA n=1 Tax=Endocarpon pusillum (strain Z07020 / HMAS-L-300199) TaxID=1263415 RepID=U1GG31_ENDPU|nr:uncharacterized protein EPUS_04427 [Endocarpon pusillum Z07020]ERF76607.1 hypothetical protein EPUS_04427 [Endocarpon pusillum Z07020]
MSFLKAIRECLTGQDEPEYTKTNDEKTEVGWRYPEEKNTRPQPTTEELAASILSTLFTAEKSGHDLDRRVQDIVRSCGWYEGLAKRVLDGLVAAVKSGAAMGGAMKEASDKATVAASDFVHEHPVFTAAVAVVVAIGILVLLAPWAVEALGFGELGPIEGSFAAWWQSTFPDVEAGSFFSYLQRLGMRWGRK